MADYAVAKYGAAHILYVTLDSTANPFIKQVNPTIALGDVTISIDGGTEANLATTPVVAPAGGKRVKVTLSVGEMTGDNINVVFHDVAGAEWGDHEVRIQTSPRGIADLAYPIVSGRGIAVAPGGQVGPDWSNVGTPTSSVNLSGTTISNSQVAASVTAPVTVGANNDKLGYGLSTTAIQAIWDKVTSALTTPGSIGKALVDFLSGSFSDPLAQPIPGSYAPGTLGYIAGRNLDAPVSAIPTTQAPTVGQIRAEMDANSTALSRLQGLAGHNAGVRNQVYDVNNNLTSADLCFYDTAAHAIANDGSTGLLHKWAMAFTYSGSVQTSQSISAVS